jgi:Domain of unknown function (DUF4389)
MASTYPLNLEVTSPAQIARWRPLLNWLLVIPPLVLLVIYSIGLEILSFLSWFVILFTGKLPETWGAYMVKVLRYQWRIYAYLYGWTEEYPGFDVPSGYTDPGGYPAVLTAVPDATRNRLTVLLRAIWVIPAYVVVYFVGIAASVVLLVAWFVVLFTGKWPEGMRQFCIGYVRWNTRVQAYLFLLTDVYPPFSLEP